MCRVGLLPRGREYETAMTNELQSPEESQPPTRIFLSYARQDRARAEQVIDALEAAGFDVWWDGLLDGGVAFATTTEDELEGADAVVVLWSKTSIVSHWVLDISCSTFRCGADLAGLPRFLAC